MQEQDGRKKQKDYRKAGSVAILATALLCGPLLADQAYAFKLFGMTIFGDDDENKVEVIDPVRYDATLDTGNADKDLKDRLEAATSLVKDDKQPVSGDLGVVIKAREDRERLVAALYEEARYGGTVHITIAGTDLDALPPNPTFDHSSPVPVTVRIDPGPAFRLGSVHFEGDAAGRNPHDYKLDPGTVVGSRVIINASERLLLDVKKEGRPLAKLTERKVTADHRTSTVDVVLGVNSGPVASFGAVAVKGSRTVDASFISHYSRLDKGGRYSPDQLKKANDRLRELGVFSSVTIHEADQLAPDGTLPLTIEVSDSKPRYYGVGADYSSIDGGGLQGYWGHRNLFGEAESLKIEGKVSGVGAQSASSDFNYSAGITFTKPGAFVPQATFESKLEAKSENPDTYQSKSLTYSAGLAYELNDTDTVKGGGEIAYIRSTDDAFGTNDYLTFSTPLSFERDTRDNKLDPTEGYHATLSAEPSYEAYRGNVFSSFEGSLAGYLGLGADDRIVLAARLAGGTLVGANKLSDVPSIRRFYEGGGGSVRGYAYQEISPYNSDNDALGGRSYGLGSFEMRVKVSEKIGIVPFVDVGTVSTGIVPDFSDIRAGAGIGIRYATPFGPLRLDVALPLQRYDGGSQYGIYAGIGQAF